MKIIERTQTKFKLGLGNKEQAKKWLLGNQSIRGVCFLGRSNVGKSSTINALFGNKTAKVSNTPGKTREINIFTFSILDEETNTIEKRYFFDLPGYGYAKMAKNKIQDWNELMEIFFEFSPPGLSMINLRDARHDAQESDLLFLDFLKNFKKNYVLVFNKIDKLKTQKERAKLNNTIKDLKSGEKNLKCFKTSAETKIGMTELEQFIIEVVS